MHSFYKNKKTGKQRVFQKKKDAKNEAAGWEGPAAEKWGGRQKSLIAFNCL
jgi:hypothetical protein